MWVLFRQREILLEKRPSLGIWGGLWSLPEAEVGETPHLRCAREYGLDIASVVQLPDHEHGFTHFRLCITPLLILAKSRSPYAAQAGTIWLSIEDAKGAAIPAPIRKILSQLPIR